MFWVMMNFTLSSSTNLNIIFYYIIIVYLTIVCGTLVFTKGIAPSAFRTWKKTSQDVSLKYLVQYRSSFTTNTTNRKFTKSNFFVLNSVHKMSRDSKSLHYYYILEQRVRVTYIQKVYCNHIDTVDSRYYDTDGIRKMYQYSQTIDITCLNFY